MTRFIALASFAALAACATNHTAATHAHNHAHGSDCGHMAVAHNGHTDYLHDGHMHHVHDAHYDEHVIKVSALNPDAEAPLPADRHDGHMHTMASDAHEAIPHGDHVDFLHDGHLHHPHGDHIDEHGPLDG